MSCTTDVLPGRRFPYNAPVVLMTVAARTFLSLLQQQRFTGFLQQRISGPQNGGASDPPQ